MYAFDRSYVRYSWGSWVVAVVVCSPSHWTSMKHWTSQLVPYCIIWIQHQQQHLLPWTPCSSFKKSRSYSFVTPHEEVKDLSLFAKRLGASHLEWCLCWREPLAGTTTPESSGTCHASARNASAAVVESRRWKSRWWLPREFRFHVPSIIRRELSFHCLGSGWWWTSQKEKDDGVVILPQPSSSIHHETIRKSLALVSLSLSMPSSIAHRRNDIPHYMRCVLLPPASESNDFCTNPIAHTYSTAYNQPLLQYCS